MAFPKFFKKKEAPPAPISAERKSLIKLPEGTLVDVQPITKDKSEKDGYDPATTYTTILHAFPSNSTVDLFVNSASKVGLEIGTSYNITFKTGAGIYKDTAEITEFFDQDAVPHIGLNLTGKTIREQRRKHVRVDDYLKFDFEIIEKKAPQAQMRFDSVVEQFENFQKQKEVEELKTRKYMNVFFERCQDTANPITFPYSAETLDISAGGMRFISNYKLETDSILGVALDLHKTRPILLIARINYVEDLSKYSAPGAEAKPAIQTLNMFKQASAEAGSDSDIEVNDTYNNVADLNYIYKCVFLGMNDDSKSYLHDYIMDKTLL